MITKNLSALKKIALSLAVGWTVAIAVLCLVDFNSLPSVKIQGADKYVHITLHFVFILFWGLYASLRQNTVRLKSIFSLVVVSICYGLLIEVLQETFTTTRHADVFDVLANLTGALIAFLVFMLIKKRRAANQ